MKTNKEYLASPNHCPKCNGDSISGHQMEVDDGHAWQSVDCSGCGFEWTDLYNLVGFEAVTA